MSSQPDMSVGDVNETPTRPLRIALLLDELTVPAWAFDAVQRMVESSFAEVALLVLREHGEAPAQTGGRLSTWYQNRDFLLYTAYTRLDARRHSAAEDASRPVDLTPLLSGVPRVVVRPRETKFCDYFDDAVVEEITSHDLDVAVRFGFRILKGGALSIARHGVWSFHHGSDATNRGGPAGVWEVLEGSAVTGFMLQVLTEELDNGRVLERAYRSTVRGSITMNRRRIFRDSPAMLLRQLRRLHAGGVARLPDGSPRSDWTSYSDRLYTMPRTSEVAPFLWRRLRAAVRSRLAGRRRFDQWSLAYHFHPESRDGRHVPHGTFYRFKPIVPSSDRFWADPFPWHHEGRHFVFFEELPYATGRGHVSVIELTKKGIVGDPVIVLERPYHLSYPFVFEWRGEHYMVPETERARRVELYRATDFPFRWELDRVLLEDVNAVDATPFEHGGQWWMFVGQQSDSGDYSDEVHLYGAPAPTGPWEPHPLNPVVSDVRRARPAGRPFAMNGALYRPAQDCSERYGGALVVHRVDCLSMADYRETPVTRVAPRWAPDLVGLHTLNADTGLTVIDLLVRRRRR